MSVKIKKFLSFFRILLQQPSLINIILNDNDIRKRKFLQKYPNLFALPQIEIKDLHQPAEIVETFLLDGSSMITDLQLLVTLAKRKEVNSYFEIGTWRGESVFNVAKEIDDCNTLNLSEEEMKAMGWNPKYVELHGILSKRNPKILHLHGNTKNFDFAGLQKKYDLIFIDGDHTYEMVLNDTKKVFAHLLHENSIVVWHDYAYNPQKIRYEVFQAILDGTNKENHRFLYHPKNTMCAVFIKEKLPATVFDVMENPDTIFQIGLKNQKF
ncbi:MAG: class I SAM-dependent methyltransferase [Bergeyella sp.]